MEHCLFCRLQQAEEPPVGGVIYADELVYAHHWDEGEEAGYLGHLVVQTRRHVPDFAGLSAAEAQAVGLLIARLSAALKDCVGAEKVYAVFYGEVTPHLHVHLTARYPRTPEAYWRWKIEEWPEAPRGTAADVAALCRRLRAALATV